MEKEIKLVGSKFTSLASNRNPDFSGKISMSSDIKLISLEKVKDSKDTIKVKYSFKVDYKELGFVALEGFLYLSTDQKIIKSILKSHEDKKFNSEEMIAITNAIVQRASIKAIELEDELGLPVHIRIPVLSPKK